MAIPTSEPAALQAGDTLRWQRDLPDYPANQGWVLSYRLVNAAGKIDLITTAVGALHEVNVPASISAMFASGDYTWVATVTKGAERYTIGQGQTRVLPDLAAAASADTRSPARRALDDINAALATYGAKAYLQEIQIGDRRQKFHTPADFLAFRSRLTAEVAREDAALRVAQGLSPRNKLLVRFAR